MSRVDLTISMQPTEPSSARLVLTLALAGMLSGATVAGVYQITKPTIDANKSRALNRAVLEVVPGATRMDRLVLSGADLVPAGEGERAPGEVVFAAYDGDRFLGYAIEGEGPGFQDTIRLLFGYEPRERVVIGMVVLESRETPGLGDKIYKDDAFVATFSALSVEPDIVLVKDAPSASNEVDAITGATISSRAVVGIIRDAGARWWPVLPVEGPPPAGEPGGTP